MRQDRRGLPAVWGSVMAVALLWAGGTQAQATGGGFTPQQRAEIVEVVRDALRSDPSILRDAVQALQQDETARQGAASQAAIAAQQSALTQDSRDPVAGNPAGDVTLVEFYDTRCPYCRAFLPTMATMLHDDPNLRVVYKDLPVLGANSLREAKALIAAQRQGGYFAMQNVVMHLTAPSTDEGLQAAAVQAGMDGAAFARDMADPAVSARLDANLHLAAALHVEGTPAFVVGGRLIPGAVPLVQLQQAVAIAREHPAQ